MPAQNNPIQKLGGGSLDPAELAILQQNGDVTILETDKNIYVTAIREEVLNQKVVKKYVDEFNTVTTYVNSPGGSTNGQIQYYKDGAFEAVTQLMFDESRSDLTVFGNIRGNNFVTSYEVSANTISAVDVNATGNVTVNQNLLVQSSGVTPTMHFRVTSSNTDAYGNLNAFGNVTVGNSFVNRTLTVNGNLTTTNANLGNLVSANYIQGVLVTSAQPNLTSAATTLTVGNVRIEGNHATATSPQYITTLVNNAPLALSVPTGSGNREFIIYSSGNISLPDNSSGNSALKSGAANGLLFVANVDIAGGTTTGEQTMQLTALGNLRVPNTVVAPTFQGVFNTNSNAQPNITSLGTLTGLTVGNATANSIFGNGTILSGNVTANIIGNALSNVNGNVGTFVTANITSTDSSTPAANIQGILQVIGNTILGGATTRTTVNGTLLVAGNMVVAGTYHTENVSDLVVVDPTITLGAALDSSNRATAHSTATSGDRGLELRYYDTADATAFIGMNNAGNFRVVKSGYGATEVLANLTVNVLNASNITGATVTGNIVNGTSSVNVAASGNVTLFAAGNATVISTGTGANITGYLTATGNVTAPNFMGALANTTSSVAIPAAAGNVVITSAGNATATVTGTGANITGYVTATGNITGANLVGTLANGTSTISIVNNGAVTVSVAGSSNASFDTNGLTITNDLDVDGNITTTMIAATLTNSIATSASNVVLTATTANISAGSTADVVSVSATGVTTSNVTTTGDVAINGGDLTTTATTFNLVNATATTLNIGGAATAVNIGAATGTATFGNAVVATANASAANFNTAGQVVATGNVTGGNIVTAGDVAVNGGDITTTATTFNLANTTATTVNAFGSATAVNIGAAGSTTALGGGMMIAGDIVPAAGTTSVAIANTVATTVNFARAATTLNMGAATGTTTIGNALVVTGNASAANFSTAGDLAVNGGDITSTSATLNVGASGNTVAILGALTVAQNATVTGDLGVNGGDITTTATTINIANTVATTVNLGGAATVNISSSGNTTNILGALVTAQTTTLNGSVVLTGAFGQSVPTSAADTGVQGEIRMFNNAGNSTVDVYICVATNQWIRTELAHASPF
jgi:hypothetical protein